MEINKTRTDEVFGTLHFDSLWSREMQIDFCGKSVPVELVVYGELDEPFDEGQYLAYTALMEKWQDLEPKLLPAILEYYIEERQALGYDIEQNEDFPPITTTDEIAKHIEFACITVPWAR